MNWSKCAQGRDRTRAARASVLVKCCVVRDLHEAELRPPRMRQRRLRARLRRNGSRIIIAMRPCPNRRTEMPARLLRNTPGSKPAAGSC